MLVGITGATGFLGRYIVHQMLSEGHTCRCWFRPDSNRSGFEDRSGRLEWIPGQLGDPCTTDDLVRDADVVVHAALHRAEPGLVGRGDEGEFMRIVDKNLMATLRLMQTARCENVKQFIFISSCAVHEVILDDRPLDEAHPLWPTTHYGAHKAAVEMFVHSFGLSGQWNISALRPTGIYGLDLPARNSRWFDLVQRVMRGDDISSAHGGKEVHAADVARAVSLLMRTPPENTAGQVFNCCDLYVADQDVAQIAKAITGSRSHIEMLNQGPKHQIQTQKIRDLGMAFGGRPLLEQTVRQLVQAAGGQATGLQAVA